MQDKLEIVLKACEDRLGEDIKKIDLEGKSPIADYFVIVTGNSQLHTQAISKEIEDKITEAGYEVKGREGFRDGGWILMDLGEIIVHIFTEEKRDYYDLEKLWD